MKTYLAILWACLYIGLPCHTLSQSITGKVSDSLSGKPLAWVNVSLGDVNGKVLKHTQTNSGGSFSMRALPAGTYLLVFSMLGYTRHRQTIHLSDSSYISISLAPAGTMLNQVMIKAQKPIVRHEADRLIYDLQADPDSKSMNMLEIMRKVPFLSVDANDKILLKGKTDYRILINDKPSGMMASNPEAILKSMPAATIERIEIITQPSAKYDAEGYAGIINIVTKRNTIGGYNVSVNINGNTPAEAMNAGTNIAAKAGSLGVSFWAGTGVSHLPETAYNYERNTLGDAPTRLSQEGNNHSDRRNGYLGTELRYEADSLNLLTAQFGISGNRNEGGEYRSSVLSSPEGTDQQYSLQNENEETGASYEAGVNYQRNFRKNKNRMLTFSYRFIRPENRKLNKILSEDPAVTSLTPGGQRNNSYVNEHTFQADYVHGFKKITTESGIKGIFRKNGSNFQYDTSGGSYINDQQILSLYHVSRVNLKTWNINAGLRLEHTATDILFSNAGPVQQNYFNVVPSVSFIKNFSTASTLNFGFSQRIKRPGINKLNPFTDRSNPNYEISGNPELKSSLINSIRAEFSRQTKLSLNIGVDYVFLKNLELQVSRVDRGRDVTVITYENIGKGSAWSSNFNLSYPASQQLKLTVNGNITYIMLEGTSGGDLISARRLSENIFINMSYRVKDGWRLNAGAQHSGRNQVSLQGTSNPVFSSSAGIQKDLAGSNLSFSASVNNPFSKFRENRVTTTGPAFHELSTSQQYFRSFRTSLTYTFGKLKDQVRKNQRGIKNDDLSN